MGCLCERTGWSPYWQLTCMHLEHGNLLHQRSSSRGPDHDRDLFSHMHGFTPLFVYQHSALTGLYHKSVHTGDWRIYQDSRSSSFR